MKSLIIIALFLSACAPSLPASPDGREDAAASKPHVRPSGGLEKGVNSDGSHYAIWHS